MIVGLLLLFGLAGAVAGVYWRQRPRADTGGACRTGSQFPPKPSESYPDGEYETRYSAGFTIAPDRGQIGDTFKVSLTTKVTASSVTLHYFGTVLDYSPKPTAAIEATVNQSESKITWTGTGVNDQLSAGEVFSMTVKAKNITYINSQLAWDYLRAEITGFQGTGVSKRAYLVTPTSLDLDVSPASPAALTRPERVLPFTTLDSLGPKFRIKNITDSQGATVTATADSGTVDPSGELSLQPNGDSKTVTVKNPHTGLVTLTVHGLDSGHCPVVTKTASADVYGIAVSPDKPTVAASGAKASPIQIKLPGGERIRDYFAGKALSVAIYDQRGNRRTDFEFSVDNSSFTGAESYPVPITTADLTQTIYVRKSANESPAPPPANPPPNPPSGNSPGPMSGLINTARAADTADQSSDSFWLKVTAPDGDDMFPLIVDKSVKITVEGTMVQGSDRPAAQIKATITVTAAGQQPVAGQSVDLQVLKKNGGSSVSGIRAATDPAGQFNPLPQTYTTNADGQIILYIHAKDLSHDDAKQPLILRVTLSGTETSKDADLPVKYATVGLPGVYTCLPKDESCTLEQ